MVEHSEDHKDIVNHKELKDLLETLPPPPEPPEPLPPQELLRDFGLSASNDSAPEQNPKPPKRKDKKKKDKQHRKQSLGEADDRIEAIVIPQFNPFAVVNKSEQFKKEFLRRLPLMFQEGEEVLVISLGYSSIDCPGMFSEEKVLRMNKCNIM